MLGPVFGIILVTGFVQNQWKTCIRDGAELIGYELSHSRNSGFANINQNCLSPGAHAGCAERADISLHSTLKATLLDREKLVCISNAAPKSEFMAMSLINSMLKSIY